MPINDTNYNDLNNTSTINDELHNIVSDTIIEVLDILEVKLNRGWRWIPIKVSSSSLSSLSSSSLSSLSSSSSSLAIIRAPL